MVVIVLNLDQTRCKRIESKIPREAASKTQNISYIQNISCTQNISYTQNTTKTQILLRLKYSFKPLSAM